LLGQLALINNPLIEMNARLNTGAQQRFCKGGLENRKTVTSF